VLEAWQDDASQQAHDGAAHTAQFRSRLSAIHNSPYDQRVHHEFAAGLEPGTSTGAFYVVTHVDVPPPRKDETEKLLRSLAAETTKEPGNLRFEVFQQLAPRTNHFTVYGIWNDERAFEAHELKPHTRQFREALGPLLGAPYDQRLYRSLG
jgi:quinol monooxygenase YgiN